MTRNTTAELHATVNLRCQDRWRESFFSRKEPIGGIMHARGVICPSYHQFFFGDKPLLFTDGASIRMYGLDEAARELPSISWQYAFAPLVFADGRKCRPVPHRKLLYWKEGASERAMQFYRHFKDGPTRSATFHRIAGILLCYPLDEVDAFCQSAIDEGTYADD